VSMPGLCPAMASPGLCTAEPWVFGGARALTPDGHQGGLCPLASFGFFFVCVVLDFELRASTLSQSTSPFW
jgi:hypothetical protein